MSMRMLFMEMQESEQEPATFKLNDKVIWEYEDGIFIEGIVKAVSDKVVAAFFPELDAEDEFYPDGRYTKFEKVPSLTKKLPKGSLS